MTARKVVNLEFKQFSGKPDDYGDWAFYTKAALKGLGSWSIVNGTLPRPGVAGADQTAWDTKEEEAQSLILSKIAPGALVYVRDLEDSPSSEIWTSLENQFRGRSVFNQVNIEEQINQMAIHDGGNLVEHIEKMADIIQKYRKCGGVYSDATAIRRLLGSMKGTSFHAIKAALGIKVSGNAATTWAEATEDVRMLYLDMKDDPQPTQVSSQANPASRGRGPGFRTFNRGQRRGFPRFPGQRRIHNQGCFTCGDLGHWQNECPRNRSFQNRGRRSFNAFRGNRNFNFRRPSQGNFTWHAGNGANADYSANSHNNNGGGEHAFSANNGPKIGQMRGWYIDSGASSHMTPDRSIIQNLRPLQPNERKLEYISLGDNYTVKSEGIGTVKIQLESKPATQITLKKVLFVPELAKNLMSVDEVVENGGKVEFHKKFGQNVCTISRENLVFDVKRSPMSRSYLLKGSYSVGNVAQNTMMPPSVPKIGPSNTELWHKPLGHVSVDYIKTMVRQGSLIGIPKNINFDSKTCDGCIYGKHTRSTIPKYSESRENEILGLIHSDVFGPTEVPSKGDSRFYVSFVDDYSRYTEIICIKQKSQVCNEFIKYVSRMERQTGHKVKALRSDNGGEYVNNKMKDFCERQGIVHQFTAAYTPQQNGVAERYNRTLRDSVRAMLHECGASKDFWAEAAMTSNYVINRRPTSANDNISPYELFFGKAPDLKNLRVFGCDVTVQIPQEKRRKLDKTAYKAIFIGYPVSMKGYRVWDPVDSKVKFSRDVQFSENSFQMIRRCKDEIEPEVKQTILEVDSAVPEANQNQDQSDVSSEESDDEEEGSESESSDTDEAVQQHSPRPQPNASPTPRRSARRRQAPKRYRPEDYEKNTNPARYQANNAERVPDDITEPKNVKEALNGPYAKYWKEAMDKEYDSLLENGTWEEVPESESTNVVGCKWVYKVKRNADGTVSRPKARLVAQGYSQEYGIDYEEVYAPVARTNSIRTILALANKLNWSVHQMDVTTAFLNGDLEEQIYMRQPEGRPKKPGIVLKLKKSLYGLKQSARQWNKKADAYFRKSGFRQGKADQCVYYKQDDKGSMIIVSLYVDDIMLTSNDDKLLNEEKQGLSEAFKMVDQGPIHYILGISVSRDREKKIMKLSQKKYLEDVLQKFGMSECKSLRFPLEKNEKFLASGGKATEQLKREYQSIMGCLNYAVTCTRPDLAASVNMLSKFNANPSTEHMAAAKRILRYIKGTLNMSLVFKGDQNRGVSIVAYSDADWAGDLENRKSTGGYVFYVCGGAVSWRCQRQPVVALSSTEAEYIAMSTAAQELVWLRRLLKDIGFTQKEPTIMKEDNRSATALAKNPAYHGRTKHIDVKFHYVRERVESGDITIEYCDTTKMIADIMTKNLGTINFERHRDGLGVY